MTLMRAIIASVIKHEGGYVNHPNDPGGETKFGISKRSYPHLDIKNLAREDAERIYERDYWAHVPERLPDDVRWFAMDIAVNHGVGRMRQWLNTTEVLVELIALRLRFYAGLETFATFGRGWTRRVAGVLEDIRAFEGEEFVDDPVGADTVVLHRLSFADRLSALLSREVVFRGTFAWRYRSREDGGRLDVRRE